MKKTIKLSLAAVLTLSATGSFAAGFQLAEISTSGLGSSFSGNAVVAEDASVVATNPALMTEFTRPEISVGGIYINAKVNIDGKLRTPRGNMDASNGSIVPNAVIPNLYFVLPVNERFSMGGGINVNYGLKSEFRKDNPAGFLMGMTSLKTINYNLSGAAKLGNGFSFGLGVNAIQAEAELDRYAGVLIPQKMDTEVKHLEGKEWGYGWNVGLAYNLNENHRFGFGYHSGVNLDFTGKFSSDLPLAMKGTNGASIPAELSVTLPAFWELSAYHKLTDKLALQYSWKRTDWSAFKELKATSSMSPKPVLEKPEHFSDTNRYALGVSYQAMEKLTLRVGIAYEEGASKKAPSVSIPDTDRTWYSVGATYQFTPNLSADVGYAYVYGHKNNFVEVQKDAPMPLTVKSRSHVNLFGLNVNYKF
ncbi:porin [Pasteurella atlantica]|uniref:porin n=1 Tax=Pasteurellaceae TaxID=712 RepID=UPI00274E9A92|nr:porin [Pasteurella atlantica]MDP8098999.1 porin [Pasteurella atlantica]MDP8107026.1 porin [Pasteurella atlantica]MDP8116716.1 porin [Pasteurella atlantica]